MKNYLVTSLFCIVFAAAASAQDAGINEGDLIALDSDGDAAISMQEFEAFSSFAFDAIDTDGDGVISKGEALQHVDEERFNLTDANSDGTVSKAEFMARMKSNFEAADKDGDGQLN